MRRPVERTEDKKLNSRLRQRGASGLLRIVKKSTSSMSFIRSKIGSHLSLEDELTDGIMHDHRILRDIFFGSRLLRAKILFNSWQ